MVPLWLHGGVGVNTRINGAAVNRVPSTCFFWGLDAEHDLGS